MKIPHTVKIGGHTVPVHLSNNIVCTGEQCIGTFESTSMDIHLDASCAPTLREYAFWHEIVHAIDFDRVLGLTEAQIQNFSGGLYAFLKDNGFIK